MEKSISKVYWTVVCKKDTHEENLSEAIDDFLSENAYRTEEEAANYAKEINEYECEGEIYYVPAKLTITLTR